MKGNLIDRRYFIKYLLSGYFLFNSYSILTAREAKVLTSNSVPVIDSDYVIINGWVLLKSDVALA